MMLLGIDIGTSACKAALFDQSGKALRQASGEYAVAYPKPGWAEQDANDWWETVCSVLKELLQGVDTSEIAGVGVDGQSWSAIAVDRLGNVLAPTPIWTDTRAQTECDEVKRIIPEDELFNLCGNPFQPSYTLPKILWYKRHMPRIYENAAYILQSNSFIVYRLTGMITQDMSQGYGYACFDTLNGRWDTAMTERLHIRADLLPPLYDCCQVVGGVTAEAARLTGLKEGTPVVAGGLDAACGTLGAGVTQAGQTQEQGGQAGGMSLCVEHYAADKRLIVSRHVVPGKWLLQGGTTGGGGALKWLRETICPEHSFTEMSELAQSVPPGSDGLLFLPYMAGERSPIWNPDARGVFYGLNYQKTRAHMIRAVMEGVAYALRHNLETAREAGAEAQTLRSMGGSASSLVWTQIKADVTGCAIEAPKGDTATALGAAILAGVGAGVYDNCEEAARQTVTVTRRHTPVHNAAYEAGYAAYRELYTRLEPMMCGAKGRNIE